ncbi:undecaprenyl-diphosphatase [Streptomyces sp. CG 926]|uniref:phosphatase PAP2 family protein n=1 Tax=Streptomyces sp. CG 926 TaxID=1882405 RepID=UPI000D6BA79F|nr:phosphatase PAP2 family protein [Streptomyces sp. CG 926]PWK71793.1 undecaprenyl-diphosphatase [Streptomyces sp. CG 926]
MDSSGLYRAITDFAHRTPSWVQSAFEIWTAYGLLLFGVLFVAVWWRSRGRGGARPVALAVLAPVATAVAYGASECVKYTVGEERPCRSVVGAAASLVPCPGPGDGSFPSNHAALAGAAAVALTLAVRRLAAATAALALLMAFSRVFVGVHHPHDVVFGLLLGGSVAALTVLALSGPAQALVTAARAGGSPAVVRFTGPGPARPRRRNVPGCRLP